MGAESKEYQKAVDYLCGLVKEGELKIGSKLPAERQLAKTLSIGRNSTREALRMLENMGVVESRRGSGNYIVGNMSQTISRMMEMMIWLKQISREDVIVFRRDLDKAVCSSIIAGGMIEKWYDKIMEVLSKEPESQSLEEQIEADWKFHSMLVLATENQLWIWISEAVIDLYQHWIDCLLRSADFDTRCRLSRYHRDILLALRHGSIEEARKAVDGHYDLVDLELRGFRPY